MSHVLVDSNVLLDILKEDERWFEWSSAALVQAGALHTLAINQIIYAEISVQCPTIEELDDSIPETRLARLSLPWDAAFLAGKCFSRYRKRGGIRTSPLPDFFIGAHAAIAGIPLITRDATRYRTYFPKLEIIAPV